MCIIMTALCKPCEDYAMFAQCRRYVTAAPQDARTGASCRHRRGAAPKASRRKGFSPQRLLVARSLSRRGEKKFSRGAAGTLWSRQPFGPLGAGSPLDPLEPAALWTLGSRQPFGPLGAGSPLDPWEQAALWTLGSRQPFGPRGSRRGGAAGTLRRRRSPLRSIRTQLNAMRHARRADNLQDSVFFFFFLCVCACVCVTSYTDV